MFNQWRGKSAPLVSAEIARSYAEFGSSRMLPRAAYLDPEVFAWEQANIFSGWQCVGSSADVGPVGTQRPVETGAGGVLLVRAEDGVLRAFANTCRHRGHELVPCGQAPEQRRSIVCPYHAWSYKLDGRLRNAPGGFRDLEGFDKEEFGLFPMEVVEWHGWVFVDPSGEDGPFEEHVAGLEEVVAAYRPEDLVTVATHSYELATNWKVIAENYQECYHCSSIHPELTRISPPASGENIDLPGDWMGGWMDLIPEAVTMSLDGTSGGTAIAGLSDVEMRTVMYLVGYPNLLVSLHPDYVMTHLMRPLGPERTHVECSWAFPREAAEAEGFDPAYAVDFWDLTNRQDWAACESVQRGLASPYATPGPLAPEEDGVYQFVSRVARAYAGLGRSDDARPSMVTQPADDPLGSRAHEEHEGAVR
jgi:glycine betaine catabolism A